MTFWPRGNSTDVTEHRVVYHSWEGLRSCSCPSIQKSVCTKYLGILLDNKLNFQQHIQLLAARVRKLMVIFRTLRQAAEMGTVGMIYYALCQSLLTYCITSWGGSAKSTLLKLERAQRAVLKVSQFLPFRYPTSDLYEKSGVLTVRQLFILQTVLKQHSILYYSPDSLCRKRRKDIVCTVKPCKTSFARRFFNYQGCNLYNKLNRILSIYPREKTGVRVRVRDWLVKLNYLDTERLLRW